MHQSRNDEAEAHNGACTGNNRVADNQRRVGDKGHLNLDPSKDSESEVVYGEEYDPTEEVVLHTITPPIHYTKFTKWIVPA